MTNRYIFTTTRPTRLERLLDLMLALIIAGSLTMAALDYFDVLTK